MKPPLLPLLTLAAGLAAGFALGRFSAAVGTSQPGVCAGGGPSASGEPPAFSPGATRPGAEAAPGAPVLRQPLSAAELVRSLQNGRNAEDPGFAELQQRLSQADLPVLIRELSQMPGSPARTAALQLALQSLADKDPAAAWRAALALPGPVQQRAALLTVAALAVSRDPKMVFGWAAELGDPALRTQIQSSALHAAATINPRLALDLALSLPGDRSGRGTDGSGLIGTIFSEWANRDLEGAAAALRKLDTGLAAQALEVVASALAQKDAEAAWRLVRDFNPEPGRPPGADPRQMVIAQWAQTDPQAALQAAHSIPEAGARSKAIAEAIQVWAGNSPEAAFGYAITLADSQARANALLTFILNKFIPPAKLLPAVLERFPPGDQYDFAVSSLFDGWADEDPRAAAAALSALPPGRALANSAARVAAVWMASARDRSEVFRWIETLPPGQARSAAIANAFGVWAEEDPAAAARGLAALSGDRREAQAVIASSWARRDPRSALRWAAALPEPGGRDAAVERVIRAWAQESPEAAAAALPSVPPETRRKAMEAVASSWASRDLEGAARWLDRQPNGPDKDDALRSFSAKLAGYDPRSALSWAALISDPGARARQTERVAREWLRAEPAAAAAWIRANLPEETRRKLLK